MTRNDIEEHAYETLNKLQSSTSNMNLTIHYYAEYCKKLEEENRQLRQYALSTFKDSLDIIPDKIVTLMKKEVK